MELSLYIDHSQLKPTATRAEILAGAEVCRQFHFVVYCVNSSHVGLASDCLATSETKVAATVAFPFGSVVSATKADEARRAVAAGAQEIDMVADIGALKAHEWSRAAEDISAVVRAVPGTPVKVILETGYLNRLEIREAIACVVESGAAYVKNSTGFGPKGAELDEMTWIRTITPPHVGVKAAGGIRTYAQAVALVQSGINRLGCGSSVGMVLTSHHIDFVRYSANNVIFERYSG